MAEWAPQGGVMLVWPHPDTDWAPLLPAVEAVYARLAAEILRRETLLLVCRDAGVAHAARAALRDAGAGDERLRIVEADYDDTWARDTGPLSVAGDPPSLVDFRFDGWDRRYPAARDDAMTAALAAAGAFRWPLRREPMVLEGGSLDTDGEGSLLTTRRCLLESGRNPGMDAAAIERRLSAALGITRVIWLANGELEGDETDAHVDNLARFVDPHTIVHAVCDDPADPHHAPLAALTAELAGLRRPDGSPYRLVPLPLPAPVRDAEGRRLPASYVNFLIIDGAVLVPAFDDPADAIALARLAACLPGREAIRIPSRPLLVQGGGIHCVSMQLPRGAI